MKQAFTVFSLVLFTSLICSAQELVYREALGEYIFTKDNEIITMREMIRNQPKGSELRRPFRSANRNKFWANVFAVSGGIVLGAALSDAIWEPNDNDESLNVWQTYAAGAVLIGLTFPLNATADKRIAEAVERYNEAPPLRQATRHQPQLYAGTTPDGVGVGLRF